MNTWNTFAVLLQNLSSRFTGLLVLQHGDMMMLILLWMKLNILCCCDIQGKSSPCVLQVLS